jgi:hypothetical protein
VSPNSYGFGAPLVSMPVERSRVSWRPALLCPAEPSRSRSARYPRKSSALSVTFELHLARFPFAAAAHRAARLLGLEVRRRRDVAGLFHALDDLLDQFFELSARAFFVAPRRHRRTSARAIIRKHAPIQQRLEDRIVQRPASSRSLSSSVSRGLPKPLDINQVGQLRHELVHVELVEQIGNVLRIFVFQDLRPQDPRTTVSCNTSLPLVCRRRRSDPHRHQA